MREDPINLRHAVCVATGGHVYEAEDTGWMGTECVRCGYEISVAPTIEDYLRQRAEDDDVY